MQEVDNQEGECSHCLELILDKVLMCPNCTTSIICEPCLSESLRIDKNAKCAYCRQTGLKSFTRNRLAEQRHAQIVKDRENRKFGDWQAKTIEKQSEWIDKKKEQIDVQGVEIVTEKVESETLRAKIMELKARLNKMICELKE